MEQFERLNYLKHIITFIRRISFGGEIANTVKITRSGQSLSSFLYIMCKLWSCTQAKHALSLLLWSAEVSLSYICLLLGFLEGRKREFFSMDLSSRHRVHPLRGLLLKHQSTRHRRFPRVTVGHPWCPGSPQHPCSHPTEHPTAPQPPGAVRDPPAARLPRAMLCRRRPTHRGLPLRDHPSLKPRCQPQAQLVGDIQ